MPKILAALMAGTSFVTLVGAAQAQDATPAQDIIVTGSRVVKNGDNSPTPVTVVSTESLSNLRPTSLTESINTLPVFSGSRGQFSNPGVSGGVSGGNGSAAQLNLRNLGGVRNLVLLDGRRVPPTSYTNIVDADVIPQLLVKRVDTVTGGVSAVYGSDAVSGVVNFVTDTKFEGLKVQAQYGLSTYSDDPSMNAAIAWGSKFAGGRGHFEISYEYRNDDGIMRRSQRSWYNRAVVVGNGTTIPYSLITNGTLSAQPFGGKIISCGTGCALAGQYFASNGVLSSFTNGTTYSGTTTQSGGAGGYLDMSLKASQRSHQVYARTDYDFSDNVHGFLTLSGNFKKNVSYGSDISLANYTLSTGNAFLPSAYAAQMTGSTFVLSEINTQIERARFEPQTRQLMAIAGLEGKLGEYNWNVSYVYGDSRLSTTSYNTVNNQKLSAALDAVSTAGGPACYAATQAATASAYANCVPLNLFGPSASSQAALNYIMDTTHYVATTRQHDINAAISGSPFSTWAGEVTAALSGEWRAQSFISQSDATPSMYADCTNLRYNCVATGSRTLLYAGTLASNPHVSQSVWEVAGEVNVPLLKDVALAKSLAINAAARYTKYNTVGTYWTWKLGADWHIIDGLRFRGTISRDIRAPTLNDLFSSTAITMVNNQDLKTGATNLLPSVNVSNPNLTAEIGNTWTAGLVAKPSFLPGFSLAVDYYDIKVSNAITTVQGFQPTIQQGCNTGGLSIYCNLIQRDSSGNVTAWYVQPINLSKITTYGLDVEANYVGAIAGHKLALRALAAYQPHIRYIQPGVATVDQGGVAFGTNGLTASPSWRLTGTASFNITDTLRVDAIYRWRNAMKLWGDPSVIWATGQGTVAPFGQLGMNISKTVTLPHNGKADLFFNVQNLFNATPPAANAPGTSTAPGGFGGFSVVDDAVGRYFTAGFRAKF
ncbi:TonB-dependent receptor domain-containing protein [Novosphingobium sediminicola]|uniref:Outer membrane receptor protein involved in Fe transport n=1 Tax=Novosphingobium sediminicola TaxID=563162 RepID=A0A7W6CD64_9SPHN|nr:TonB-dependent receptor [Novosphingobium sediminicola]MBB3954361.1 outer membrane receptor protein involved in Fe transport [Novosphingobium sediminicola]